MDKNKSQRAEREEELLTFWKENDIFNKTLTKESPKGDFVFYEGPPTANGKPGIHHLEARAFKDAIPRYKTMQGYHVARKGGWDTHGLPVELQVEKALGLNSKKAIEEYGIEKFNEKCKESVWEYRSLWEKFTDRIGYWVDQKNPYVTYHNTYIESLWNIVKKVEEKGLLYKDYKIVPWCPRCGTALSSHELAQGYQDDKDLSVTAKFKVDENTYILAWTTTPWTLPGNVALAVGEDIEYVKIKKDDEYLILAKERLEEDSEIIETMKGKDLVGTTYEPLYPYLKDQVEDTSKAFQVYAADFVTTEDGTGVVHTAVMYGQDDFELGTELGLPKHHLVGIDGLFLSGTDFLEGRFVKDEDVAVDIIKDLAHRGLLFKKEKYEHSYPHCWRCKTALIYYARDSWYIRTSSIKDTLIEENQKINWEPNYIKDGRFGEWLKDLKDWAISRERYWGTPLPLWTTEEGEVTAIGSLDELKKHTVTSGNSYFVMRHGVTTGNGHGVVSYSKQADDHVTQEGVQQVEAQLENLKDIDVVISSPFTRTKETAEIIQKHLDCELVFDDRIAEINPGEFDGKTWMDYHKYVYEAGEGYFTQPIPGGESLNNVRIRTASLLYELEEKYKNKKILLVTHGGPAWLLYVSSGMYEPNEEKYHIETDTHAFTPDFKRFGNAEVRELSFVPVPHNRDFELDLHRPYIDDVELEKDGKKLTRVKDVMDVWFDSGAMPFAQAHYPFSTEDIAYPADFISEAIDQTRGWFYTLHAVGSLMDRGLAYKNVICLGHILDEEGKKMSKSLGNIVDPWEMMDKYGVDTLRLWMYAVNQPGESKNFDEKTVFEMHNKVFNLLYNVLAFYELYRDESLEGEKPAGDNPLDAWILERLTSLTVYTTRQLDEYKLLEPVRAIRTFIDDLSTWYVRRSRDRLKDGDMEAKKTLYVVLTELAKLLAPFAPFAAEDIWQKLKKESDAESVHLSSWTQTSLGDAAIITQMQEVRNLVTLGLEKRQQAGIKVRQPLTSITIVKGSIPENLFYLLKEELNVKEVIEGEEVLLDTEITEELQKEGNYREFVRSIQALRKKADLVPTDEIDLNLSANAQEILTGFEEDFKKQVLLNTLGFTDTEGEEIKVGDMTITASLLVQ